MHHWPHSETWVIQGYGGSKDDLIFKGIPRESELTDIDEDDDIDSFTGMDNVDAFFDSGQ